MTDLRRPVRLLSAALVAALAALAPAPAFGAEAVIVAQETSPEGVVLPDEDDGERAQEEEGSSGSGREEESQAEESTRESAQEEEEPASERSERETSSNRSSGDSKMPNTGPMAIPAALLGLTLLGSGVALRHKTRRRRRMRW